MKVTSVAAPRFYKTAPVNRKKIEPDNIFILNRPDKEGLAERLESLMEDISEEGQRLSERIDISGMKKYRGLVREFVNEVVTNSRGFERENFLDRKGRHRVFGTIKTIDKTLDELAEQLFAKEKNGLDILEKTGQIEGLLMDLMI
jgi:uncharacterized protein YaaR (DUF327 family)